MMDEENTTGDQMGDAGPVDNAIQEHEQQEQTDARQVPLNALQAERAERQRLQDELNMVKENMSLMMSRQQQPPQQTQEQDYNISKEDVITYGDLEKILETKERQYQTNINELRAMQKYPDYEQVVKEYLPTVLKDNPGLHQTLKQTNDYELAYYLAKNSDAYKSKNQKSKRNDEAERILENAQRAGSLSSMGGGSPINVAKQYKQMSDEEFRRLANRNLGYS